MHNVPSTTHHPTMPQNLPAPHPPHLFASGDRVPHPCVAPQDDGGFAIRLMLRIAGEIGYADFHHRVGDGEALLDFLESFRLDPTGTCDTLWGADGLHRPTHYCCNVLRRAAAPASAPAPVRSERLAAALSLIADLDI